MSKILVVCLFRTGYTQKIAAAIATQLSPDIECIQALRERSGIWGYLHSLREALKRRASAIRTPRKNPPDYDLVILGTPVWANNMCSPMCAYIMAQKDSLRQVALFCTQGASGAIKVLGRMAELCRRTAAATLILKDDEIKNDRYADKLNKFLGSVALPQAA